LVIVLPVPAKSKIAIPQFDGDEMESLTVKLPRSILQQLRIRATKRGHTIADDILDAYACHADLALEVPTWWANGERVKAAKTTKRGRGRR
jgi:hypothetical protein